MFCPTLLYAARINVGHVLLLTYKQIFCVNTKLGVGGNVKVELITGKKKFESALGVCAFWDQLFPIIWFTSFREVSFKGQNLATL